MNEPTLRRGARGEWVTYLQQLLQQAGYDPGAVDGDFGSGTQQSVREFQRSNGLAADGVVGPSTWAALTGEPTADSTEVPAELVAAGAPTSLTEWTDEQLWAFFDGPVTSTIDAGTPEDVPLLAMTDIPTTENGTIG